MGKNQVRSVALLAVMVMAWGPIISPYLMWKLNILERFLFGKMLLFWVARNIPALIIVGLFVTLSAAYLLSEK